MAIIVMMVVVVVVMIAVKLAALFANFLQFMPALLGLGTLLAVLSHRLLTIFLGTLYPFFTVAAPVCVEWDNTAEQATAQHNRHHSGLSE